MSRPAAVYSQLPRPRLSLYIRSPPSLSAPTPHVDTSWALLLSHHCKQKPLTLSVLSTLVYEPSDHSYVSIYTDEEKVLKTVSGREAWDHFFAAENRTEVAYLYHTECGLRLTGSSKKAQVLAASMQESFLMQTMNAEVKARYRVAWGKHEELKVEVESGFAGWWQNCDLMKEPQWKSEYLHDLRVFPHAGQLRKSSFSHFSPYPSVLATNLKHTSYHSHTKSMNMAGNLSPTSSARTGFGLVKARLEVRGIVETVYECLSVDRSVTAFVVILVENKLEQWCLQDVTNVVYAQSPTTCPSDRLATPQISAPRPHHKKSFSHLSTLAHPLPKIPFVDMSEVHSKCVDMYTSYCSTPKLPHIESPKFQQDAGMRTSNFQVEAASKQLEAVLETVEISKGASDKEERYHQANKAFPGRLLSAVKAGYKASKRDPILDRFFQLDGEYTFECFSGKFLQAMTEPFSFQLAANLCARHKSLNVTEEEFGRFVDHLCRAFEGAGGEVEGVEVLKFRMNWYKPAIIRR